MKFLMKNESVSFMFLSTEQRNKRWQNRDTMKNCHLIAKKLNNPYLLNISDSINLRAAFLFKPLLVLSFAADIFSSQRLYIFGVEIKEF